MGNLGGGEMLVIFFVALIVLGPNKLPEAARQVGRAVNEIRRVSGGFQREMREAMNEPIRAAEEAKAQIIDPFGQAKSSAGTGAAGMPKAGGVDDDPPLPSVSAAEPAAATEPEQNGTGPGADPAPDDTTASDDQASADAGSAGRPPLETTPIPTPPAPFAAVSPPDDTDEPAPSADGSVDSPTGDDDD